MVDIGRMWRGEMPLSEAFWTWVVTGGLAVNLSTSAASLVLLSRDMGLVSLAVGYGLSLPYNIVASVCAWRAAARHVGPVWQGEAARISTLCLMAVLSVT